MAKPIEPLLLMVAEPVAFHLTRRKLRASGIRGRARTRRPLSCRILEPRIPVFARCVLGDLRYRRTAPLSIQYLEG
jgi:hypothetical protein